jgi:two-component system, OmpR family, phosphate regulon response regulator PhoB
MRKARLLLVEDDPSLVELLTWHFEKEDYQVDHTPDGEDALLRVEEWPPDVIVLDWMIEGVSGLEVCRRLRKSRAAANIPIVMVSGRGEEEDRIRGLETGADDYVTKPFSPRELVARVAAVNRRIRPAMAAEKLTYADIEMDLTSHKVKRSGKLVFLGPTEYRLLKHFLETPRRVFSRGQLMDALWGRSADIEMRTVDVHIRRLRKALSVAGGIDLIRTVRAAGYSLDMDG